MKKIKTKTPRAQSDKKNGEKVKLPLDEVKPLSDEQLANVWSA